MLKWFSRSKNNNNNDKSNLLGTSSSSSSSPPPPSSISSSFPKSINADSSASSLPKMKLTFSGFNTCPFYQKAINAANGLSIFFPDQVHIETKVFDTKEEYISFMPTIKSQLLSTTHSKSLGELELQRIQNHKTSPMVWKDDTIFIGGCNDFIDFSKTVFGIGYPGSTSSEQIWKGKILAFPNGYVPDNALPEKDHGFQYDLVVIGGGSGGLALSKQAATLGANVALLDFVKPSPQGSEWGLGGTCVNVGCIPKKYFHQAALLGEFISDARSYGWNNLGKVEYTEEGTTKVTGAPTHNWRKLVRAVQDRAASSNFVYRVLLREKKVNYLNLLGSFIDPHTIIGIDKKGKEEKITSRRFVIAVGGRPKQLDCPGGELAITSDDIFSMERQPGKTLIVGASYVALECAGFLSSLGYDVTVMVRSVLLRGFDQEMAQKIGKYMEDHGTKFIYGKVPIKLEEIPNSAMAPSLSNQDKSEEDDEEEEIVYKNKIKVFWDGGNDIFDTVLCAVGRIPDTKNLGLEKAGVKVESSGKIVTINEQTNIPHIYAVGDVLHGKPELTPTAIMAGNLLADRLYGKSSVQMNYRNVSTTIFTPIEYGTVGLGEEDAIKEIGNDNIEVYHSYFTPLDWNVAHEHRKTNECYLKVIVNKLDHNRILGMHYLGPNAGEIIQGYGVGMKMGMTFEDLTRTVAIHPTSAEEFILLNITKRSGVSPMKAACCG